MIQRKRIIENARVTVGKGQLKSKKSDTITKVHIHYVPNILADYFT